MNRAGRGAQRRRAAVMASLALAASGCASGRRAPAPSSATEGVAPWELPAAAVPSQRLYRARYEGPEGEGTLRLTLRLASRESFQLAAADRLGRPVWALEVRGATALWIDHQAESTCHRGAEVALPGWEGSPFTLSGLPAVLLGALPAAPPVTPARSGPAELVDALGRLWSLSRGRDRRITAWTLWALGEPEWWWRSQGRGGVLSQRGRRRQLEWEELVAEPLAGPLAVLRSPPGYRDRCPR